MVPASGRSTDAPRDTAVRTRPSTSSTRRRASGGGAGLDPDRGLQRAEAGLLREVAHLVRAGRASSRAARPWTGSQPSSPGASESTSSGSTAPSACTSTDRATTSVSPSRATADVGSRPPKPACGAAPDRPRRGCWCSRGHGSVPRDARRDPAGAAPRLPPRRRPLVGGGARAAADRTVVTPSSSPASGSAAPAGAPDASTGSPTRWRGAHRRPSRAAAPRSCGLSLGGYVALALAARHPERVAALVLADTRAEPDTAEAAAGRHASAAQVRDRGPRAVPRRVRPAAGRHRRPRRARTRPARSPTPRTRRRSPARSRRWPAAPTGAPTCPRWRCPPW